MTALQAPAHAGAWLQEKGHGLLILSTTMLSGDKVFDAAGHPFDIPRYNRFDTSAWLEYGLTDGLTLVLRPQFRSVSLGKPYNLHYSGLGYTGLGARIGLWSSGGTVLSLQSMLRIPGEPLVGSAQFETETRLLYGHSYKLGTWPAFIDTQFAYRFRAGIAPDEVRSDVTFGVRPRPDLMMMAQAFSTFSFGGFYASGWEYKVQLSAVWDFAKDWSVQVGGSATVAGVNALQERGYFAAIWKRF
ncbi:MAG: hypothetical protein L0I29_10705 [Hyphomicrobiales bacterium]|nr:hypothetical protein [Hyphomicrobiales bacterium]